MLTLVCAVVGEKGSAFAVDIDANESVADLKDAIKRKNDNYLKRVDADNLQLFLGKKSDGTWLDRDSCDTRWEWIPERLYAHGSIVVDQQPEELWRKL